MSIKLPELDPIEYLINRKYPASLSALFLKYGQEGAAKIPHIPVQDWQINVAAYRIELECKTPQEITALYEAEHDKEQQELQIKAEQEEKVRPFNQPSANADFDFWSKAKHWTLDEAIALSFGRSPHVVHWTIVAAAIPSASPFALKYAEVRELALRAIPWQELFDPVLPGIFIGWARRIDIDFPDELERMVIARGGNIADWKQTCETLEKNYNALKTLTDETHKKAMEILDKKNGQLIALIQENQTLEARLTELEKQKKATPEKTLKTRERDTLLKLIIGIAVAGYRYNPKAMRNGAIAEITGDLDKLGITLSDDTIREKLREAAEFLPPEPQET